VAGDARDATDATGSAGWLLLVYRVPSEPTRLRAAVWRRIKTLGAIYLQNSVAALPQSPSAERSLRMLRNEIMEMNGTAILLSCGVLAGDSEIRSAFIAARDDEYEEVIDKCRDFLAEVEKEYAENHFSFAELEENEVDLIKLRTWLQRIRERDVFGASGLQAALSSLAECEEKLEAYAARVYAEEAESR
jgi:DNA-binding transcriptional regulator PaaX